MPRKTRTKMTRNLNLVSVRLAKTQLFSGQVVVKQDRDSATTAEIVSVHHAETGSELLVIHASELPALEE